MIIDFPRRLAEVSLQWLSEVLGMDVASFESSDIGAGKGMMGDIFRLELTGAAGEQLVVVAKFSADREELRIAAKRAGVFEREVNFYRHIAPTLKCRIPRCYGSWFDPDTAQFVILMESIDVDPSVNQIKGMSFEQARTVVGELAALHIPSSEVVQFRELIMPASSEARRTNQRLFVGSGWERLRKLVPEHLRVALSPGEMADRLVAAIDVLAAQTYFLLHGDARPDNLLFSKSSGEVVLVDWQGLMFGPREWDLGYFFAQGLQTEDRRNWSNALIDHYLSFLPEKLGSVDRQSFVRNIGKAAWFSFGVACSLFTVADTTSEKTIELAASMGERSLSLLFDAGELP